MQKTTAEKIRDRNPKDMVLQIPLPLWLNPQHFISEIHIGLLEGSPTSSIASRAAVKAWDLWNAPRFYPVMVCTGKSLEPEKIECNCAKGPVSVNFPPLSIELTRKATNDIHCFPWSGKRLSSFLWDHFHLSFTWDSATKNWLRKAVK